MEKKFGIFDKCEPRGPDTFSTNVGAIDFFVPYERTAPSFFSFFFSIAGSRAILKKPPMAKKNGGHYNFLTSA